MCIQMTHDYNDTLIINLNIVSPIEDNNIFIGNQAGARHILSDRLIIDAYPRADQATEITNAIIYGI